MRKTPEINNGNSMGMMLTLAIAMANGSAGGSRCKQKRVMYFCVIHHYSPV